MPSPGIAPPTSPVPALLCAFLGLVVGLLPAAAPAANGSEDGGPRVPPGVALTPDQTFCQMGETTLKLNVACPRRERGPYPAVVIIHGGGWVYGNHRRHVPFSLRLAREGYVAVTVTYRLAPAHRFPAQLQDVKCAVRWLRANAEKFDVDRERIGAFGFSAGGHLACLLGSTLAADGFEGDGGHAEHSSRVQAAVSYYGVTDLARLHESCHKGELPPLETGLICFVLEGLLGGPPAGAAELYRKASPVTYARKSAAPTLLVHGTADRKVPCEQSVRYEQKLREAGAATQLLLLENAPHDFGGEHGQRADAAALEFLARHLKRAAGS